MNENCDWLPKEDLLKGRYYEVDGRNFTVGMWNGNEFVYLRSKFGSQFLDTEYHYDDGPPYGTAKPYILIEEGKE